MKIQRLPHRFALTFLALALCATQALAQYVWLDEKGTKQFSDLPPPPSVPANRILKQPGGGSAPAGAAAATDEVGAPAARPDISIADKNAEFKKRKAEQAEKEKKAADEAKRTADKAKNCERIREYQRVLDSGIRIARSDKDGERSFLTDEQREREVRETKRALEDCK